MALSSMAGENICVVQYSNPIRLVTQAQGPVPPASHKSTLGSLIAIGVPSSPHSLLKINLSMSPTPSVDCTVIAEFSMKRNRGEEEETVFLGKLKMCSIELESSDLEIDSLSSFLQMSSEVSCGVRFPTVIHDNLSKVLMLCDS